MNIKPVLLFGYGNPSRGDDALGPMLLEAIENSARVNLEELEILSDFQLQIEHSLDLKGRDRVLFVDASVSCSAPFRFSRIKPRQDDSYTTHEMSPSAVLQVYQTVNRKTPPPVFLLSIRAEEFGLGEPLSLAARLNLDRACKFTEKLLTECDTRKWQELADQV